MRRRLIIICAAFAGCTQPSTDSARQVPDVNHYQIAVDNDGNAWRLDTRTGETKKCWQGMSVGGSPPSCYTAIQK